MRLSEPHRPRTAAKSALGLLRKLVATYLDSARTYFRALRDVHCQHTILEARLGLLCFQLIAQDEAASIKCGADVRIQGSHALRHVDLCVALDHEAVLVRLQVEPVTRYARHIELQRDPVCVLEYVRWRDQCHTRFTFRALHARRVLRRHFSVVRHFPSPCAGY